jgi:predicted GIY-YIG superfamily endonuclease
MRARDAGALWRRRLCEQALLAHNAGGSPHTARFKPWKLLVSIEFPDQSTAARFERYLKSGSGRAFAKRHFGSPRPDLVR